MNSAKQLQKQREKWVCDTLIDKLNLNAKFERYGNDINEPDCIYESNGELIGIEVATAYPENVYAKQKWTLARGERQFPQQGYEWLGDGPIFHVHLMRARIQNEIDDKCSKRYFGVDKTFLCIKEDDPLSDDGSFRDLLQSIKVPERHCFNAIFLLHHAPTNEGGDYEASKIYGT
jgi:hypothetical protein